MQRGLELPALASAALYTSRALAESPRDCRKRHGVPQKKKKKKKTIHYFSICSELTCTSTRYLFRVPILLECFSR